MRAEACVPFLSRGRPHRRVRNSSRRISECVDCRLIFFGKSTLWHLTSFSAQPVASVNSAARTPTSAGSPSGFGCSHSMSWRDTSSGPGGASRGTALTDRAESIRSVRVRGVDSSTMVAILALVFSILAFVWTFRLQRRLADIELARRSEEVTSKLQANMTARFERYATSRGQGHRLVLANGGPARAEDVSFDLVDPVGGKPPSLDMANHRFPIRALAPGQEYPIVAFIAHEDATVVDIMLHWK